MTTVIERAKAEAERLIEQDAHVYDPNSDHHYRMGYRDGTTFAATITPEQIEDGRREVAQHEYRVNEPGHEVWVPLCACGWSATEPYDVEAFDRHIAAGVLRAAGFVIEGES